MGLALIAGPLTFFAQTPSGTITGIVRDPSGALIPQARITVTAVETGTQRHTAAGAAGAFTLSLLEPGQYTMLASAPGFRDLIRGPVHVGVTQTVTLELVMQVGSPQDQAITVNTDADLVVQSGQPLTFFVQTAGSFVKLQGYLTPDLRPGMTLSDVRGSGPVNTRIDNYFGTPRLADQNTVFAAPGPAAFGGLGRGLVVRSPGQKSLDLSISKVMRPENGCSCSSGASCTMR